MRPVLRLVRACAAVGAAAYLVAPWSGAARADDQTVTVGSANDNRFSPATVTIDKGDTVTWQYGGGVNHTVTSTSSNWSKDDPVGPPNVQNGLSTTFTFTKAGTYTYVCKTHESTGMKGKVVVLGATKPKPTRTPTRTPATSAPPTATGTPSATTTETATPTATPSGSPSLTPRPSGSFPIQTPGPFTPGPTVSQFLGEGGLTRQPESGRAKGLPFMVALLLVGGVGSAELRALLANAPRY